MKSFILAVETGGTKIQMAIGTPEGKILFNYRTSVDKGKGFSGILDAVSDCLPMLMNKAKELTGEIKRIGIGFGGPVDTAEGIAIWSAQIEGWGGFPVKEYFERRTGLPTYLFNDSNAAAWGEYCLGAGKGSKIFFYTNIGSGVGGGMVINGELFDGQGFGAAEFGQSYLCDPFTKDKNKFPYIQVEKLCSGWGIEKRMREDEIPEDSLLLTLCGGHRERLDTKMLSEGVRKNDAYSIRVLDETAELFSVALCNVICLFSPEVIAVGGGVSLIGDPLIERLNVHVKRLVYKNSEGRYRIVKSLLDEDVVLAGTLLLTGKRK